MDYKDSTNQSDWIRSDQISSRPDPLETVEDQRRTFESAYKKESVLAIVAIVSFLCIFGSIHIPAIICDKFIGVEYTLLGIAIYFVFFLTLTIACGALSFKYSRLVKNELKKAVKSLIEQSFILRSLGDGDKTQPQIVEATFNHFKILPRDVLETTYNITDTFEASRQDISFKFFDIRVVCEIPVKKNALDYLHDYTSKRMLSKKPDSKNVDAFVGQMITIPMQNPVGRAVAFGICDQNIVQCMEIKQDLGEPSYDKYNPNFNILRHLRRQNDIPAYKEYLYGTNFDIDELKAAIIKLKTHLRCPFIICMGGTTMYLIINSNRDLFESDTKSRFGDQKNNAADGKFDEAVCQVREDVSWIAGMIDILSVLRGHGLA